MAIRNGTNGNNNLVGTSTADTFNPLLGVDTVDGLAGIDTLNINYSAVASTSVNYSSTISESGGSYGGTVYSSDGANAVTFSNIEVINYTGDSGSTYMSVTLGAVVGGSFNLNAGGGSDYLTLNATAVSNTTFTLSGNTVTSNLGTFSNWEAFNISLGAGTNSVTTGAGADQIFAGNGGTNTLNAGAGDDSIYSLGGVDAVDGGANTDFWTGDYSASVANLTFVNTGAFGSGSLSNGTTLTGIEYVTLTTGSGNDTFTVGNNNAYIYAGAGVDTLTMNLSGTTGAVYFNYISSDGLGGFSGYLYGRNPLGDSAINFTSIEAIAWTGGDDDNTLYVDAASVGLGATLNVNGGLGSDRLTLDASTLTGTTFILGAGGAITSNVGTFAGFESFEIYVGGGTNSVTTGDLNDYIRAYGGTNTLNSGDGNDTIYASAVSNTVNAGAGNDTIYSTGGVDAVDGGADSDGWYGDYSASTANLDFTYSTTTGAGSLSNGTTLTGIEGVSITTGSGNDSFAIGNSAAGINGGAGVDTLTGDFSGNGAGGYYYFSSIGSDGLGGFGGTFYGANQGTSSSYWSALSFSGIDAITFTLADGDDYLGVYADSLAFGATLNISGGLGTDRLVLDASTLNNTTFAVGAGGAITTNRGTYTSFESFDITLGAGTNSVTTGGLADTISANNGGTNTLNGGAGDDTFNSRGGVDAVNGGADNDNWTGDYGASVANLTFTFNGATGTGGLSNGTTLTGIETVAVTTGSGNDNVTINNTNVPGSYLSAYTGSGNDTITLGNNATQGFVDGGADTDTLTVNHAGTTGAYYYSQIYAFYSGFNGDLYGAGGYVRFYNIDVLNYTASDDDNYVYVDASPLASGATLNINGGVGTDTLYLDARAFSGTSFTVSAAGVIASNRGSYSGFETFIILLGGGANSVTTGANDDTVYGGTGNDTVNGRGGTGDVFVVAGSRVDFIVSQNGLGGYSIVDTNLADGDQGTDTVTNVEIAQFSDQQLALPPYGGVSTITGTTGVDDPLNGTNFDDAIFALAGNDRVFGLDGNDTLNGGLNNDLLDGGAGIDTASYSDATGLVKISLAIAAAQNTGLAGIDTLVSIENLIGSAFADTLTGNALANRIEGGAGKDAINGGAGADTMIGGADDDTYTVDNAGDVVTEELTGGTKDLVKASVSWILGDNVENLTLSGAAGLEGRGNDLANALTGNSGGNVLYGFGGKDLLNGGLGADTMYGGTGDDTYTVDNLGDVVIEDLNAGTKDLVKASVSWTLGDNFENLTLGGSSAINGIGNVLANTITGNTGSNVLSALGGKDVISGGLGNDRLIGGAGADVLTGGAGADSFVFDTLGVVADRDTVKDFTVADDTFEFVRSAYSGFATTNLGTLTAAEVAFGTAAVLDTQHLIYTQATGALFYDADGNGAAAQVQIAVLSNLAALTLNDFVLI